MIALKSKHKNSCIL